MSTAEMLRPEVEAALQGLEFSCFVAGDELTVELPAGAYLQAASRLLGAERLAFTQLIDLCGVDYSGYEGRRSPQARFAVVLHLLSVANNQRLRLRVWCDSADFPLVPSVVELWPAANWFEREAFDMFGIIFEGHPDLRRILTDYGFCGHPFRKDFPVSGHVEMIYDEARGAVVYQPVSIEPRENTPRIRREDGFGGAHG